jgi:hypothetical protein
MNETIDERLKARIIGVMLAVVGVVAAAYPFFNGPMPRKLVVALLAMGPFLVWFDAGLAFVPVPESVFKRLEQGAELGTWLKELPRFWKFWAPLSLVVLLGAMIGADALSR